MTPPPAEKVAEPFWTLADLRAANVRRQAEWCPDQQPDLSFRAMELAGETGEACNIAKKLERERRGWLGTRATRGQLASELADIVICADLTAMVENIDLMAAVRLKFNETTGKVGLTTLLAAAPAPSVAQSEREAFISEDKIIELAKNNLDPVSQSMLLGRKCDGSDSASIPLTNFVRDIWQARASAGSARVDAKEHDSGSHHLIDGEFQSDKYPTTPRERFCWFKDEP